MIKFMRSAVVMIACVAGFGAWAATVAVDTVHTYASELFGEGHAAISYPDEMTPMVTLTIPRNIAERPADTATSTIFCPARNHNGSVDVTFELLAGEFASNVTGLMWDPVVGGSPANTVDAVTATSAVATIEDGGREGDSHVTIRIAEADADLTDPPDNAHTARTSEAVTTYVAATTDACVVPANLTSQTISFELPKLKGLDGALMGASKAPMGVRQVSLRAESRIISGAFTDSYLTGNEPNGYTTPVVKSRDAVTVSITPANTKDIVIKGDNEFKAVKQANSNGYVELATVTVATSTKFVTTPEEKSGAKSMYRLQETVVSGELDPDPDTDGHIYKPAVDTAEKADTLYDLNGEKIDQGLRGVLTVDAEGTRDLFNEMDMLFIDYDKDEKMRGSEDIALEGNMGMGTGLAIDPDDSASFKGGKGTFKVYYMPGGKDEIQHGAMIKLMANVDYSDPSATDEEEKSTSTTFNFEGVTSEVMAYAIPQTGNGKLDKANVRVRCESAGGCNVFVECWDDDGMRMFGKAGTIKGNNLMRWTSSDIEGVVGIMGQPTSRHSCRILSAGRVTVQALTRDGQSGALVNNTYIGE